jgi:long-chain acyl-CoA synthetase
MDGYWNQPDATAGAIRDGWLHTGDVGEIVEGRLQVTDRKKDILVLSGGEKVWPARLESLLSAEPEIAQAVVAGDGQHALSALLVAAEGADEGGVAAAVGRVNKTLSPVERIRRHAMVPAFTIENGLLTPSQKVRRAAVMARFADALDTRRSP